MKMHRIFAMVLVLAMLLSVLPMNTFATEAEQIMPSANGAEGNDCAVIDGGYRASNRGASREDDPNYLRIYSSSHFGSDDYFFLADAPADDANYSHYALTTTKDSSYAAFLSNPANFDSDPSGISITSTAVASLEWKVTYSGGKWTIANSDGQYLVDSSDDSGVGLTLSSSASTTWTVTEGTGDYADKFYFKSSQGNYLSLRTDLADSYLGSNGYAFFCATKTLSNGCSYFNIYRENCPHTYRYDPLYDGTHLRTCTSLCGVREIFDCTMSDGVCTVCGYSGDHTLSFVVPDGVEPIDPIVGSKIAPPIPVGEPSVNPNNAVFVGWTGGNPGTTTQTPTLYYPGRVYNLPEDVTLYAVYAYAESMTFTLYDGSTALAIGDRIAFVAREYDYAMSGVQNNNNRASVAITKEDDTFTVSSADNVAIVNVYYGVNGSSAEGEYAFYAGKGYLTATSSSKNYLKTEAELLENSTWTYSIDETTYAATIAAMGEFTRNTIRYNASNNPPLFSCYDPSNATLRDVQIYKLTSESGVTYTTEFESPCEHIFSYTSNDDGTHIAVCDLCGYSETCDCDLTDGACPECGYSEAVEYTVTFVVPAGVDEIDPIVASEATLPTPSGTPENNHNGAKFIGWAFEPVDNDDVAPMYLNTTTLYPITEDMTLYALYSYVSGDASEFELYDGSNGIEAGDSVIIVAKDYDFALSATQNTNNRVAAPIVKDGTTVSVTGADNVEILTLEEGTVDGTIAFKAAGGYLTSASSSGNYLRTAETLSENSSWSYVLDASTNEVALTAQGTYTRNTMRFNKSSSIFACYAAENSQYGLQIYVQTVAGGGATIYTTEFYEAECEHEYTYSSNGDGTHTVECGNCDYFGTEDCNLADGPCPACGYCLHEYSYSSNGDGTHTVECNNCTYVGTEDCNLDDGACPSCGYEEACVHEYTYISNSDGTHIVECANCDSLFEEDCDLTNGTCPQCGYQVTVEYTVSFVVPDGVEAIEPITGTSATFPKPVGTPNNNYFNAVFVGWATQQVDGAGTAPFYYTAGTKYDLEEDLTVYALYVYTGTGATFTLYDGSEDLSEGTQAIIVSMDYDYAISTTQNTNNRASAEITKSGNQTIALGAGSDVAIFTVGAGAINGTISFKDEKGYLRAASSSGNYLRTGTSLDESSSWTYSVDGIDASITLTSQGTYTRNTMRYNKSSNLFACYAADNANQFALQLYVASEGASAQLYTTQFSDTCPHSSVTIDSAEATCEANGYYKEICDLCGATVVEETVAAFGHDHVAVVTYPTCTTEGYTTYTCQLCGDSFQTDFVPVGEHDYIASIVYPTCTTDGYTIYTCAVCNDSFETDFVSATSHDYVSQVITPATCTAPGLMQYTCSSCGDTYTEQYTVQGHTYDAGTVTKNATCSEEGIIKYTCTGCGDVMTEVIPKLEHDYESTVIAPNCGNDGYTNYVCKLCGHSYKADYVEAEGEHDYHASLYYPTCEAQGFTRYTCSICGHSYDTDYTPIDPEAHDHIARIVYPTCTEEGYTIFECTCGDSYKIDVQPATGHDYYANVIPATCTSIGLTRYECDCGDYYDTDYVPVLDHVYTYTDNGETHTIGCKNCDYAQQGAHDWQVTVVSEPSCGVDGVTLYTCKICKTEKTETVTSANHNMVFVPETAATCETAGVMAHYTCSACKKVFLDEGANYELPAEYIVITALGHNYVTSQFNQTHHNINCTNGCGYSASEAHSFVDGVCVCGEKKTDEPQFDENLKFTMNIIAGAEMSVNYNVTASAVSNYADFYLEVKKENAGAEATVTTYGISGDHIQMGNLANLFYYATFTGISAKEMGDSFSTTLYAVAADGTVYYGNTSVDSIADFLLAKANDPSSTATTKTMAVDMLKYGASAQLLFGYDTQNLVTASLTAENLAYETKQIPEATDKFQMIGDGKNISTNVTVGSRVELNLSCMHSPSDASAMKFVVIDAESGTTISEIPATVVGGFFCSGVFSDVGAKEMRRVITVILYEGDTAVSKMLTWSVESYVAQTRAKEGATEAEINMVNAMLTYGDSVAAYLESINQN